MGGAQLAPGDARSPARGAGARRGGADRARGARARVAVLRAPPARRAGVLASDELDEARALAAGRRALARAARARAGRARARAGDAAELARVLGGVELAQRRASAGRTRWRCSIRWRCAREAGGARAVRLRPAGGRLSRARAGRSRCWPRRSAGGWPKSPGCACGEHEDALAAERYLLYAAVSRPEELARAELARRRRRRRADAALAVRGRRLRPVRPELLATRAWRAGAVDDLALASGHGLRPHGACRGRRCQRASGGADEPLRDTQLLG